MGRLHPRARRELAKLQITRGIVYREIDGLELTLDVYRPRSQSGPLPAVLYIHGGGFSMLSKETHWLMAMMFARRGFVVFNIDYRLAPKWTYPAATEDACAAFTWIAENGDKYGVDLDRLVIAGESAGGNLSLAVALATCFRRSESWAQAVFDTGIVPRAVLPACPLLEVSSVDRYDEYGMATGFERGILKNVRYAYARYLKPNPTAPTMADPLLIIETNIPADRPIPPMCTIVGNWDCLKEDSRRLEAALTKRGVRCEAHYYDRGLHAFHAFVFLKQARQVWSDQFAFLRSCL